MSILLRRHNLMAANDSPAPEPPSPREQPFTIINNRDANCNITIRIGSGVPITALERISYRIFDRTTGNINEDSIINKNGTAVSKLIPIPNYSYVEFFGKGSALGVGTSSYTYFVDNNRLDDITVKGNIMSLLYGIDGTFKDALIQANYTFVSLFMQCPIHIDASNLILPYNVKSYCYSSMFYSCTSLTAAPALPATILEDWCYNGMFQGCSSLVTAPELPAATLTKYCYNGMFNGCTSLNYIKCLATNKSATSCINNWVKSVAASGTFVKAKNSSWSTGVSGVPSGWTVVDDTE